MNDNSKNHGKNGQPEPAVAQPDANDLSTVLQGRWQSESDSSYVIEVVDNKIRHFSQHKFVFESDIEIDSNCQTATCKRDSADLSDGWCFTEKGQYDIQCNLVIQCDKQKLQYKAIGSTAPAPPSESPS